MGFQIRFDPCSADLLRPGQLNPTPRGARTRDDLQDESLFLGAALDCRIERGLEVSTRREIRLRGRFDLIDEETIECKACPGCSHVAEDRRRQTEPCNDQLRRRATLDLVLEGDTCPGFRHGLSRGCDASLVVSAFGEEGLETIAVGLPFEEIESIVASERHPTEELGRRKAGIAREADRHDAPGFQARCSTGRRRPAEREIVAKVVRAIAVVSRQHAGFDIFRQRVAHNPGQVARLLQALREDQLQRGRDVFGERQA